MKLKKNSNRLIALLVAFCVFTACGGQQGKTANAESVGIAKQAVAKPALHPVIVEFIIPKNKHFLGDELSDAKGLHTMAEEVNVAQWKNHMIFYARVKNPGEFSEYLKSAYHGVHDSVKVYDAPFYKFDRSKCADTLAANQWTNIFLTANLLADPKMQQEYLDYHKTQFEKWPEVAKGFCNASFQQLLVFKNGRQLMLVISIPKGKTLDELNPLTTKDNPRVDQWNRLMSKYQEGLPGTKKGESWVFLTKPGAKQDGLGK